MIEYKDGEFGSISPAKDIIEMLHQHPEIVNDVKAVHIGSVHDLQMIRQGKTNYDYLANQVEELKRELETLKPKGQIKIYDLDDIPK